MIAILLMASKQLSEFEKGEIIVYNDCGHSLCEIAKKLDDHHSSLDVFLKKVFLRIFFLENNDFLLQL